MVRRNAEGTAQWLARGARLLGWTAIASFAIGTISASAANVEEVRVGTHEKSTRIVLELDQASGYRLVSPQEGNPELLIHLDAASVARDVPSKSPVVRKVRVEPSGSGSTVRIRLATANVAVKELLLSSPPRLVFDLVAQGPIPKAPIEEEVADEPTEPATDAKELASAPPVPAPPTPAKIEESKAPVEVAEPIVVAAAEAPSAPSASAAEPAPASAASAIKPAMPPAPVAPIIEPPEPADEAAAPAVRATTPTRDASQPTSAPTETSNADARRKALAAKAQPEGEGSGSIASLATSPLGLGAIAAMVLLVGGVIVMRRRRSGEDDESLYSMMASEDAGLGVGAEAGDEVRAEHVRAAPIWEPDAFDASEPTPKTGRAAPGPLSHEAGHQLTFGSRPLAPEPAVTEIAAPDESDSDSIFGGDIAEAPEPVAVATAVPVVAAASEETERRIAELERRIEQLADARERLERQVAAQTEELRVQRAAIARTQRVVRSIAKTEDMATEPVPRAPSAS